MMVANDQTKLIVQRENRANLLICFLLKVGLDSANVFADGTCIMAAIFVVKRTRVENYYTIHRR